MSARSIVATVLLWCAVPLWVLVAVDGPGPFAFGLVLAALVSLPALVVTAVVGVRGLVRRVRRLPARTATALRVAVVAHALAVASFPLSAAVGAGR